MRVWKEGEVDAFGVGDIVRFKKGVDVSVPTSHRIEYKTIESGTEGVVKSVFPFIVRIPDFEEGVFKEITWHHSISLSTELELVKDRPKLKVVK